MTANPFRDALRLFWQGLIERVRPHPIADRNALVRFLGTRAAQVAQVALFGYLKARMGMQSRELFQDPEFTPSIEAAQRVVFFAALSDLTLYAAGLIATQHGPPDLAAVRGIYDSAVDVADGGDGPEAAAFEARLAGHDWSIPPSPALFDHSAAILVQAAPVSDDYRARDGEIVDASMRYRWIEVRRQLRARMDVTALGPVLGAASEPE